MPEPCAIHDVVMSGLDQRFQALEKLTRANSDKLDAILTRLEGLATFDAATAVAVEHLQNSDTEQWSAINGLRRLVYIGVGLALAVSFLSPWLMNFFNKPGTP